MGSESVLVLLVHTTRGTIPFIFLTWNSLVNSVHCVVLLLSLVRLLIGITEHALPSVYDVDHSSVARLFVLG